jgi:hypothetical protein
MTFLKKIIVITGSIILCNISVVYANSVDSQINKFIDDKVKSAIESAKGELDDPYSAKFSNIFYIQKYEKGYMEKRIKDPKSVEFSNLIYVCGQVNYKNQFGAYSGNTVFYFNGDSSTILKHDLDKYQSDTFTRMYDSMCKTQEYDVIGLYEKEL